LLFTSTKCVTKNVTNIMSLFITLPAVSMLIGIFHIGNFCFWVPFFKKLLLRNHVVDFVEICNVCARKATIEDAKRIINSDKVCRSYSDLNFGVTFFGTQCILQSVFPLLQEIIRLYSFVVRRHFLRIVIRSIIGISLVTRLHRP